MRRHRHRRQVAFLLSFSLPASVTQLCSSAKRIDPANADLHDDKERMRQVMEMPCTFSRCSGSVAMTKFQKNSLDLGLWRFVDNGHSLHLLFSYRKMVAQNEMLSNRLRNRLRIGWLVPRWFRKLILWSICGGDGDEVVLIWQSCEHLRWSSRAEMSRECSHVLLGVNYSDVESSALIVVDMICPRKWMSSVRTWSPFF